MMEKTSKSSITKNAILKIILNIFNVIIPIITGPYLARTLDVELYGIYNKSLAFVGFLLPFAGFGIYNYGVREISRFKNDKKRLSSLFTILFWIGFASTVAVLLFYFIYLGLADSLSYKKVYYAMAIQIFASMFNVEYMNEAYENYSFIVYKTLLVRILNVILILLCVKESDDILIYALIYSGLQFLNYVLSFIYVKSKISFTKISYEDIKKALGPLAIMFVLMNCNMLYTSLDRLFMSLFSNGIYVTYYTFSQTIINIVTNVLNSLILVTIPRLSFYFGKGKVTEYSELVNKSSSIFLMLSIPLCFGFYVFSNIIMFLYGGENYIGAGHTFALFSLRMLIWIVDYVFANQVLFIQGYEAKITKIYFCCGGINVVLKTALAISGNLTSETAIITTATTEILVVLMEVYTIKKYRAGCIQRFWKKYLKYVLCSILFLPIAGINYAMLGVEYSINLRMIILIILIVAECVLSYLICLIITRDKTFKECYKKIIGYVRK